jgi:uncharacterized protein
MTLTEADIVRQAEEFARNRMKKFHSSHGWDHVERVMRMADIIAESEEGADRFIVKAAALLHDIAREDENVENGRLCHAELGSRIAAEFLKKTGLDDERISQISHCIQTHRYRNHHPPETIEARILYDADKLDSIGATGIGRAFLFSGEIGARLHNNSIDIHATEAYSKEDSAYREYMFKLRHIREKMLTDHGKKLAEERHRFMEFFFERLKDEMEGKV